MDRAPLIEAIPARWRGPVVLAAAIMALVSLYALSRFYSDTPVTYTAPEDHFKYGSTGGEIRAALEAASG